jgi:hypothetical protein
VGKNGARGRRLAHGDIAAVVATDDDFPLEVEDEDGRGDHSGSECDSHSRDSLGGRIPLAGPGCVRRAARREEA